VKSPLAKTILIAILTGPLVAFLNTVILSHVNHRYEPPLTQDEMKQWEKLPVTEMKMKLLQREVPFSKLEWLSVSVRYGYFWKQLGVASIIPTMGIFLACLCFGRWERQGIVQDSACRASSRLPT
jgi:hypothetical protein